MKKSVTQRLREHLASITKEEFQKEWAEIENLGLEGPTLEAFCLNLKKDLEHKSSLNRKFNINHTLIGYEDFTNASLDSDVKNNYAQAA